MLKHDWDVTFSDGSEFRVEAYRADMVKENACIAHAKKRGMNADGQYMNLWGREIVKIERRDWPAIKDLPKPEVFSKETVPDPDHE